MSTTDVVSTQTSVLHTERRHSECTYRLKLQIATDLYDGHSMKCPTSLCEAMVVLSLHKKPHIGYTQYIDNDVYVDDVDDDEAGAGAYFFAQTQRCSHQL